MEKDKRKVQNLINGKNLSTNYKDIWLSPLLLYKIESQKNTIWIEFNDPIVINLVNIWNYTKSLHRSVKEMEILIDGKMIYSGILNSPQFNNLTSIIFDK